MSLSYTVLDLKMVVSFCVSFCSIAVKLIKVSSLFTWKLLRRIRPFLLAATTCYWHRHVICPFFLSFFLLFSSLFKLALLLGCLLL